MNFTLRLCKPKGAPKYVRAGHFFLLQLATNCANPSKRRNSTLSPYMLIVAVKMLLVQTASEDGAVGSFWERLWAVFPCEFRATLNR